MLTYEEMLENCHQYPQRFIVYAWPEAGIRSIYRQVLTNNLKIKNIKKSNIKDKINLMIYKFGKRKWYRFWAHEYRIMEYLLGKEDCGIIGYNDWKQYENDIRDA